jgi:tRNA threonylcarbamoyladenosine biosynthesis protein TsaE
MPGSNITTFISKSEDETLAWAREFSQRLKPGDVVGLQGNLGAGKTILSKGIAQGKQFHGMVNSPSYTIVNEYPAAIHIYHIDLYRVDQNGDWEEIGIDYYLNHECICLIEWPERLKTQDVSFTYLIHIEPAGRYTRKITVEDKYIMD